MSIEYKELENINSNKNETKKEIKYQWCVYTEIHDLFTVTPVFTPLEDKYSDEIEQAYINASKIVNARKTGNFSIKFNIEKDNKKTFCIVISTGVLRKCADGNFYIQAI